MKNDASALALVLAGMLVFASPWLGAQTSESLEAVLPDNSAIYARTVFSCMLIDGRKWRSPDTGVFPFTTSFSNTGSASSISYQLVCSNDRVISIQEALTPLGRMAFETWNLSVGISGTVTSSGMLSSGQSNTSVVAVQIGPFTDTVYVDLTTPVFRPDPDLAIHTSDLSWASGPERWIDLETGIDAARGPRLDLDGSGSWPDLLPEGRHRVSETAVNRVGMESTVSYDLVVDTQAPVLSWTTIPQGALPASGSLSLGVNAQDALGTSTRYWRSASDAAWIQMGSSQTGLSITWNSASATVLVNGIAVPGSGSLQLKAVDEAGNESTREISQTALAAAFDVIPPEASVGLDSASAWPASRPLGGNIWFRPGELSFSAVVSDTWLAASGYELVSPGGTRLVSAAADFSPLLGNEVFASAFSARDRAGNTTRITWTMSPDTSAPSVEITAANASGRGGLVSVLSPGLLAGTAWWSRLPVLDITVTDTQSGENPLLRSAGLKKLGSSTWSAVQGLKVSGNTLGFDQSLPDGIYGIFVTCGDRVGNITGGETPSFTFCLDRSPPQILWNNTSEWFSKDGVLEFQALNQAGSINSSPLVWNPAQAGLELCPGPKGAEAPSDAWTRLPATGIGGPVFASDGSACRLSLSGIPASAVPDGAFSLKVVFSDLAGNVSTAYFSSKVDRTGPEFKELDVQAALVKPGTNERVVFSLAPSQAAMPAATSLDQGSGLGSAPWTLVLDGNPIPAAGLAWDWDAQSSRGVLEARLPTGTLLPEGSHGYRVTAMDRVGNMTGMDGQFRVDRSSPGLILLDSPDMDLGESSPKTPLEAGRTGAGACVDHLVFDRTILTRSKKITFSSLDLVLDGGAAFEGSGMVNLSLRRILPGGQAVDQEFVLAAGGNLPSGSVFSGTAAFASPLEGPATWQFNPAEGSYRYVLAAVDKAGNTSCLEFSLQADRSPPVISIPAGGLPGISGTEAWLGSGGIFRMVSLDPAPSGGSSSIWTWGTGTHDSGFADQVHTEEGELDSFLFSGNELDSGLADGPYRLFVTHRDQAGNTGRLESRGQAGQPFILDRSPPVNGMINAPCWANQDLPFVFSVLDGGRKTWEDLRNDAGSTGISFLQAAGLANAPRLQVEVRINGSPSLEGTAGFSSLDASGGAASCYGFQDRAGLSGLAEGRHVLELKARDPAGNASVFSHDFVLDRTIPVIGGAFLAASDGKDLGESAWLPDESVPLVVQAFDFWVQDGQQIPVSPGSLEWAVGTDPQRPPEEGEVKVIPFALARDLGDGNWEFRDKDGKNLVRTLAGMEKTWLWLRIRDKAGNLSTATADLGRLEVQGGWYRLRILQDLGMGSKPLIRSLSGLPLARLPEDSRPVSSPRFLVSPGNLAGSGFKAYETALYRVSHDARGQETGISQAMVFDAQGCLLDAPDPEKPSRLRCIPAPGSSRDTLMTLELDDLADNAPQEFYRLDVRMVSASGKPGPWASYPFRVDTSPPEGMKIRMVQGVPAPDWQDSALVELAWNRPADRSGIEAYYWRMDPLNQEAETFLGQALGNGASLEGWTRTGATNLCINLADTAAQGKWVFSLVARDTADNRLGALMTGCFDSQKPSIPQGAGIQATVQPDKESLLLVLGPLTDQKEGQSGEEVSGPQGVELEFYNLSASGRLERTLYFSLEMDACGPPVPGEDSTVVFTENEQAGIEVPRDRLRALQDRWLGRVGGLTADSRYLIKARFCDRAGNQCLTAVQFDLGTVDPGLSLSPPLEFSTRLEGFPVQGQHDPQGSGTRARLDLGALQGMVLPLDPGVWGTGAWPADGQRITTLDLDQASLFFGGDPLSENGPDRIAVHLDQGALARIGGRELFFRNLEIAEGRGLGIGDLAIRLPFSDHPGDGSTRPVLARMPAIRAGTAMVQVLESAPFPVDTGASWLMADLQAPSSPAWTHAAFSIGGMLEARFDNSRLVISAASLGMEGILSRHGWSLDGRFRGEEIRIAASGSLESARLESASTVLESNASRFRIKAAHLDGNILLVDQSEFLMSFRGKEVVIPVSNFSINLLEGTFMAFRDLRVETASLELEDGSLAELGEYTLDSRGRLVASGTISQNDRGNPETLHGLVLGKDGPDWSVDSVVDEFSMDLDGFQLNGLEQVLHPQGILVRSGTIRIQGQVCLFHGLLTDRARSRIIQAASFDTAAGESDASGQTASRGHLWRSDYPFGLHLTKGSISGQGVLSGLSVELPAELGGGEILVESARIWPDRLRVDENTVAPGSTWRLSWAGWELEASKPRFDGADFGFGNLGLHWSEADGSRVLQLSDFSWGASGLKPGSSKDMVRLRRGNLDLEAFGFRLDAAGLSSLMECQGEAWLLPDGCQAGLGRMGIAPDRTGMEKSGPERLFALAVPDAASPARLPVYGWTAVCQDLALVREAGIWTLRAGAWNLQVMAENPGQVLPCSTLVLDGNARVLEAGGGSAGTVPAPGPVSLSFPQAVGLECHSWQVGPSGLSLDALASVQVHRRDGEPDVLVFRIPGMGLLAKPDLGLESPVLEGPFPCSFQGWNCEARKLRFESGGLKIGMLRLLPQVSGLDALDFSDLEIARDGSIMAGGILASSAGFDYQGWQIDLVDGSFGDYGLVLAGRIGLPESLGGGNLALEDLRVNSKGEVSSRLDLDRFSLKVDQLSLDLESLSWSPERLSVAGASLRLPMDSGEISIDLKGLGISADGGLEIENLSVSPVKLFGMTFFLDHLGIADGVVEASGAVILPDDLPGELSGMKVALSCLKFTTRGEFLECSVRLDHSFGFELYPGYAVSASGIGFDWKGHLELCVDKAMLSFPPDIPVGSVAVEGIRFSLEDCSLAFEAFEINDVCLDLDGIEFRLRKGRFSQDGTMVFSGSVQVPDTGVEGLRDLSLDIAVFQILPGGKIGTISGSLSVADFPLGQGMKVEKPVLSIARSQEGEFRLGLSGALVLGDDFPQGIRGSKLVLDEFLVSLTERRVVALRAHNTPLDFTLDGGLQFRNICLGIAFSTSKDSSKDVVAAGCITASGFVVFPQDFPDLLKGSELGLQAFTMNLDGSIQVLDASLTLGGTRTLFEGVSIENARVGLKYQDNKPVFSLGGTICLGSDFPQGIAGTKVAIRTCVLNQYGEFDELDADLTLGTFKLFDAMTVKNAGVGVTRSAQGSMTFRIHGTMVLPDEFPQGLSGREIAIKDFTLDESGSIISLDIGLSGIECELFDALSLRHGSVRFINEGKDLVLAVAGDLSLPDDLPEGLSGVTLSLQDFRVSVSRGLLNARVALRGDLRFGLFAGIEASINRLSLAPEGMDLGATVTFPDDFPEGLAGTSLVLARCKLSWKGELIDLAGGLGHMNFTLAGFACDIRNLLVGTQGLSLDEASITLPPGMGEMSGKRLGLKNAGIDTQGNFHGEFMVPDISLDLAGFTLKFLRPSIDLQNSCIGFSQAKLIMPEMLGKMEFALNGVSISATGATIDGLALDLPDFEIPGGLQFKDIGVSVALKGDSFSLEGRGSAYLPGGGGFSAQVSFTNVSKTYPIGLKRAFFQYTLSCPGLAIGTTGLYLSAMRGGLAFGPPDEVPAKARWLFEPDQGIRLQLGITISDASRELVEGRVDTWIDVQNFAWALQGQVSFLKGSLNISASILAAISKYGFYAGVDVYIVFIEGHVELYIFQENSKTYVSASGKVAVFIPEKIILDCFPPTRTKLFEVGMEIGTFTNGKEGARGYINLGLLGTWWAFMDKDGMDFEGIDTYVLKLPAGAGGQSSREANYMHQRYLDEEQLSGSASLASGSWQLESRPGAQNLVVGVECDEGIPWITLTGPDGSVHDATSPDLVSRTEGRLSYAVLAHPEPGTWKVRVEGVLDDGSLKVVAFGARCIRTIEITSPSLDQAFPEGRTTVAGTTSLAGGSVELRAVPMDTSHPGWLLGESTARADGTWSCPVSDQGLPDGRYRIRAVVEEAGSGMSVSALSPGLLEVRHARPPLPVENLTASWLEADKAVLDWKDPNGRRCTMAEIWLDEGRGGHWWKITNTPPLVYPVSPEAVQGKDGRPRFPGLDFRIRLLDEYGQAQSASQTVHLDLPPGPQGPKLPGTLPSLELVSISKEVESGGSGVAKVRVICPKNDDPWLLCAESLPEGCFMEISPALGHGSGTRELSFRLAPGIHAGTLGFMLALHVPDDPRPVRKVSLTFRAVQPGLSVQSVSPGSVSLGEVQKGDSRISIHGGGFRPGMGLELDGQEVSMTMISDTLVSCLLPEATKPGTHVLSLVCGDGQKASASLVVRSPGWEYTILNPRPSGQAGKSVLVHWQAKAVDLPRGLPGMVITEHPSWCAPRLQSGTEASQVGPGLYRGAMVLELGKDCPDGEYIVLLKGIDSLDKAGYPGAVQGVTVHAGQSGTPEIQAISRRTLNRGEEFLIYGSGFETGKEEALDLDLDGSAWPLIETGNGFVRARVPGDGKTGMLRLKVIKNGKVSGESAPWPVFVRPGYLKLLAEKTILEVLPGGRLQVPIELDCGTGSPRLSVQVLPDPDSPASQGRHEGLTPEARLPRLPVKGPGKLVLDLDCSRSGPGTWQILIRGESGNLSDVLALELRINGGLEIPGTACDTAFKGSSYSFALKAVDTDPGHDSVLFPVWSISSGSLPSGLQLDPSGLIRGIPAETGTWKFTASVRDQSGRSVAAAISLRVLPSAWSFERASAGGTRSSMSAVSMDPRALWTAAGMGGTSMISTTSIIFCKNERGIIALDRRNGHRLWTHNEKIRQFFLQGDLLYLFTQDHRLVVLDAGTGEVQAERRDIRDIRADQDRIACWQKGKILVTHTVTGENQVCPDGGFDPADCIWYRGILLACRERALFKLENRQWKRILDLPESIRSMEADETGMVFLLGDGKTLFTLDPLEEGPGHSGLTLKVQEPVLDWSLDSGHLLVQSGETVSLFDRKTLKFRDFRKADGGILAGNCLLSWKQDALEAWNLSAGTLIWTHEFVAPVLNAMVTGHEIQVLLMDGSIHDLGGPLNMEGPVTVLDLQSGAVPGLSGWYREPVRASLRASDRESRPAEIQWKEGLGEWNSRLAPEDEAAEVSLGELGDGIHVVAYRSVDTDGLAGEMVSASIRVDTRGPELEFKINGDDSVSGGWHSTPTGIRVLARDSLSGLVSLEYQEGGESWQALESGTSLQFHDGRHHLRLRAEDLAGNRTEKEMTLLVDSTAPGLNVLKVGKGRNTALKLGADDALSGVDTLCWRLDEGPEQAYQGPVHVPPGTHSVQYRASDKAHNLSPWQSITLHVPAESGAMSDELPEISWPADGECIINTGESIKCSLSRDPAGDVIWHWRLDPAGPWIQAEDGIICLPCIPGDQVLQTRATVLDMTGNRTGEYLSRTRIMDPVRLEFAGSGIARGTEPRPESWIPLEFRAWDRENHLVDPQDVVWEQLDSKGEWQRLWITSQGWVRTPPEPGLWHLRAWWNAGQALDGTPVRGVWTWEVEIK